jgi:hypothetical protein
MTPSAMIDMRCRLPPEKVLKKSRTPPLVVSNSEASVRGSMPGSGEHDQRAEGEPQPFLEVRRLGEIRQGEVGSHLFGCGCHGCFDPAGKDARRRK